MKALGVGLMLSLVFGCSSSKQVEMPKATFQAPSADKAIVVGGGGGMESPKPAPANPKPPGK